MPINITKVKAGDIIYHAGKYMIAVTDYDDNFGNSISAVDPFEQTKQIILPIQNMFGFNFVTVVVNFGKDLMKFDEPDEDNPFGNIMQFMMVQQFFRGQETTDNNDFMKMLMFS